MNTFAKEWDQLRSTLLVERDYRCEYCEQPITGSFAVHHKEYGHGLDVKFLAICHHSCHSLVTNHGEEIGKRMAMERACYEFRVTTWEWETEEDEDSLESLYVCGLGEIKNLGRQEPDVPMRITHKSSTLSFPIKSLPLNPTIINGQIIELCPRPDTTKQQSDDKHQAKEDDLDDLWVPSNTSS